MPFDIEAARKEGYSDDEILTHLTTTRRFDIAGAQKEGYSKPEIITHLAMAESIGDDKSTPISYEAGQSLDNKFLNEAAGKLGKPAITPLQWGLDALTENAKDIVKTPVSIARGIYGAAKGDIDYLATPKPVPEAAPEYFKRHPTQYNIASKGLEMVSPSLEMVATTPGAVMANPLLAGIGYSAAKNLERVGKVALGEEEVPSVPENIARTMGEVGAGAIMQTIPQSLSGSARMVEERTPEGMRWALKGNDGSGFLNKQTPGALYETSRPVMPTNTLGHLEEHLARFKKEAKELGIKTTATEETQSMPVAQVEKQLRNWLGSSGRFKKHDEDNIRQLINIRQRFIDNAGNPNTIRDMGETIQNAVDDHLNKLQGLTDEKLNTLRNNIVKVFGSNDSYDDLGKAGLQAIEEASQLAKSKEHALYENIKSRIPLQAKLKETGVGGLAGETEAVPPKIITPNLQQTAKKILNTLNKGEDYAPTDVITTLKEYANGKPMTWDTLEAERRSLRDIGVGINPNLKTLAPGTSFGVKQGESQNYRIISELLDSIEKDQEAFTKKIGDATLYEDFLKARSFAKQNRDIFKKDIINKIINSQSPSEIINYAKTPEDIVNIKNAIGETKFNSIVKPAFTNKIMGVGTLDTFSPSNAENVLKGMNKLGMAREIYTPKELWSIKQAIQQGEIDIANKPINYNFLKLLIKDRTGGSEEVLKDLFKAENGKYLNENILSVYKILDDKGKKDFTRHFATEIFTRQQPIQAGTEEWTRPDLIGWKGNAFKNTLKRYGQSIRQVFNKKDAELLYKVANVSSGLKGSEILAGNPSGTASTLTTKAQVTALGAALFGAVSGVVTANPALVASSIGSGAAVIGMPYIMGKVFLSDAGKAWILRGTRIPAIPSAMTNWLLEGSRLGDLDQNMRDNLIKAAELYSVNKQRYRDFSTQSAEPEPKNIKDVTYKSAIQELQNRAKNGNNRIREYFQKQGLGWGI